MRTVEDVLIPLSSYVDDPRIAADLTEIYRQIGRLEAMKATLGDRRDYRYQKRSAIRVIEQRVARALRKVERAEIAA